jgi:predicted GIY-YIG superfamily endonuclease
MEADSLPPTPAEREALATAGQRGPQAHSFMPFVYILRCNDGSLYTGVAKDLTKRLEQHRAGRASRYTRAHLPVTLVWMRRVRSWSAALRQEHRIKTLRRAEKETLVRRSRMARPRSARRRDLGAP